MSRRSRCPTVGGVAHADLWRAVRRGWAAPPRADIAIAGAFLLIVLAEARFSPAVSSPGPFVLVAGLSCVLLAWRRRFPLMVAVVLVVTNLVINPDGELSTLLALVLVCFTLGSETSPPRSWIGLLVVVVPFVLVNVFSGLEPSDFAAGLVFFVGPWLVGAAVQSRTARTAEAEARAQRMAAEAETEAARAVAEERTRIARELHDIVSHSISVVAIQTQAVRRRLAPHQVREAADLAAVEATARDAMTEMRRLFGMLRAKDESVALAPQPGLGELDRLVAQAGAGEATVTLRIEGEPVPLPAGLDLTAYRILQEGVTNALRHAAARQIDVVVRYGARELELEVVDDGRGLGEPAAGGHGLIGIRERVALYGGSIDLAAGPGRGTRLTARLPLTVAA